jgi:amino acid transporter
MFTKLAYFFIGPPLPNELLAEKKLSKFRALATFSPDALSSIAYANQEIFLGLAVAGAGALTLQFPIAVAISILLIIVTISYAQTIIGYPSGGGSYIVAKENLGLYPGLVAAAALLLDYILTAAVSVTSGVAAISSAFPVLWPYRIVIALALLFFITIINLRGVSESANAIAVPVYFFVVSFSILVFIGLIQAVKLGTPVTIPQNITDSPIIAPLSLLLILHTFSAGCTALTGIEAISNGVPAFKSPESMNARKTLYIMALLMVFMFLGSIGITQFFGITPQGDETILSALSHKVFGYGLFYYMIQFATFGMLAVAANTSFAGFPRIAAILAKDKFMPQQLFHIGDRLVFHNGILLLSTIAGILIVIFNGNPHLLVPLFAIGAFSAFTLSQIGMVVHWWKLRKPGWLVKALINGMGGFITACTLIIIGVSKFFEGAWISVLIIPCFVYIFLKIKKHYREVNKQLVMHKLPKHRDPSLKPRVVIPISGVHRGMTDAVEFARTLTNQITALYINANPDVNVAEMRKRWDKWYPDINFVIVQSPYRSIVDPLLSYLDQTDAEHADGQQAILVLSELILSTSWHRILHNQTAKEIKKAILYHRNESGLQRIIIDVPYHLRD